MKDAQWWEVMTHTLDIITYSSIVTRETVHITFTMVALHDLEVKTADVFMLI